jgi:nitrogen regulatory protein P-II 1
MHLVIAYIRPEKLDDVKRRLALEEVFKVSISDALGSGAGAAEVLVNMDLVARVRLEIAVNESFIKRTVKAILEAAHTGEEGDGKIFIMPMIQCYRIRNGNKGPHAIG